MSTKESKHESGPPEVGVHVTDSDPETAKPRSKMQAELDAELAALAAIEERRAVREREEQLGRDLAAAKRARREAEVIEQLEAKHGPLRKRLMRVDTDEGMIVVGKPNPLAYKRFVDQGKTNTEALSKLVRPCVLHPDKTELDRILEEVPAALVRCADAACFLAGVRKEEAEGK